MRQRWIDAGGTRWGLAGVLALAAALWLAGRAWAPATMAAGALLLVLAFDATRLALAPLVERTSAGPWREPLGRWAPPTALAVLGFAYVWPLLRSWPPLLLDQDHAVHVERARLFLQALSERRLPLWTNLSQGGEPLVDFYGWLGCFLPAIVKTASLGRLSFERAYEWSVGLLVPLTMISAYALARRFARRSLAFAVGLLPLLGGHHPSPPPLTPFWSWHLIWGVWPALLALDLAVLSTARAIDVARRGRTRDVVLTAALATAACLTHAFGLLMLALLQGALAVSVVLVARRRAWPFLVAIAIGPMLSAFSWLPSSQALATWGLRFSTRLPEHTASFEVVLGQLDTLGLTAAGVASLAAVLRGDPLLRALAAVGLAAVLVDATPLLAELGVARFEAGRTIQWARLTFLFLFTGGASLAFVGERLARLQRLARLRHRMAFGALAMRGLGTFLFVLLLLPTAGRLVRDGRARLFVEKPSRPLQDASSLDAVVAALAERKRREPMPFRVHWLPMTDAANTFGVAVRSGVPVMHAEYAGPVFLKNRPFHATPEEERAWGARYAVVDRGARRTAPWVLDESLGAFDLWKDPTNPGIVQPPTGVGVEALAFRDDEVRLRVTGAPPGGADLRLAVAYYPRWIAEQAGQPLALLQAPALPQTPASTTHAMQVQVRVRDGEVVLRPTRPMPGTARGRSLSLWGLLVLAGFVLGRRSSPRRQLHALLAQARERARPWTLALERHAPSYALAACALAACVRAAWPAAAPLSLGLPDGYALALERTDKTSATTAPCRRSLVTRDWTCTDDDKTPGHLATVVSTTVFEGQTNGAWPIGAPHEGFRVDEKDGAAEVAIPLAGTCRRFLHPRVNGTGGLVDMTLWVGERKFVIPWTQVSTVDLRTAPEGPVTLRMTFGLPASVAMSLACDDDPNTPKPDDRTP